MSLTVVEIGKVLAELAPKWVGAFVQKVHMRGPQVALLSLRVPGETGVLRLSVEPDRAHLCLLSERGDVDPQASSFCMLLRKWVKGARVTALDQEAEDRIVALRSTRGTLRAELLGRRGRLVLCDDSDLVLAVSPSSATRPGVERGRPYELPRRGDGVPLPSSRIEGGDANRQVVTLYGGKREARETEDGLVASARALTAAIKRGRRLVDKIEEDQARARSSIEQSKLGELLKMNLGLAQRGMRSIMVEDTWAGEGDATTVEIALDPSLSPTENMERLFARARKGRRALDIASARLVDARERLELLERLKAELDGTLESGANDESPDLMARIEAAVGSKGRPSRSGQKGRPQRRRPYKTYLDAKGRPILVGRSAGDNDTLTVKVARPNDLWLHARGTAGSHVVVPLAKGEEVDSERLLDAATLAAHHSEARGNTAVEVTYTRRRYVQKTKGLPRGKVVLLREKVILLSLEPDRVERLLASRQDG